MNLHIVRSTEHIIRL